MSSEKIDVRRTRESGLGGLIHYIVSWIPIVNFFSLIFFGENPGIEEIVSECEVVVIASALLFGVMGTVPFAVSADELRRADSEWWQGGDIADTYLNGVKTQGDVIVGIYGCMRNSWDSYDSEYYSVRMAVYSQMGTHFLGIALIIACVLIWSANALRTGYNGPKAKKDIQVCAVDVNENAIFVESYTNAARAQQWWFFCRWIAMWMFIMLVLGVLCSFQALSEIHYLKFPNYYMERLCKEHGWVYYADDPRTGAAQYVNGSFIDFPSDSDRLKNLDEDPLMTQKILSYYLVVCGLGTIIVAGCVGDHVQQRNRYKWTDLGGGQPTGISTVEPGPDKFLSQSSL